MVTTIAGSPSQTAASADGVGAAASFYYPACVATDSMGTFAVVVCGHRGVRVSRGSSYSLSSQPSLYLLQADTQNHLIRYVNLRSGLVTTLAGNVALSGGPPSNYGHADGDGTSASFYSPTGAALDAAGGGVFVVS